MATNKLEITVIRAHNLYNADGWATGKSDPYVVVSVVGNTHIKHLTTPVLNNNLNPEWNFKGDIHGFTEDAVLQFEVFDKDLVTSTSIGKALLPGSDFFPYGIEGGLQLTGDKATGTLDVHIQVAQEEAHHYEQATQSSAQHAAGHDGHDFETHGHHQQGGSRRHDKPHPHTEHSNHKAGQSLRVEIIAAHNLENKDGFLAGKSDPYTMCFIQGHPYKTGIRSKTINNDLNPRWGFAGTIYGFDLATDALEFQVWDDDTWPKPDQILGTAIISGREHDLRQGVEGVVDLLDAKNNVAGSLEVKVTLGEVIEGSVAQPAHTVTQHAVSIGDAYAGGILVAVNVMPPTMRAVAPAAPVYGAPVVASVSQPMPMPVQATSVVVQQAAPVQVAAPVQATSVAIPAPTGLPLSSYQGQQVVYGAPQVVSGSISMTAPVVQAAAPVTYIQQR